MLWLRVLSLPLLLFALFSPVAISADTPSQRQIGRIGDKANFVATQAQGKWGLAVTDAGMASVVQPEPVALEFCKAPDAISHQSSGYDRLEISQAGTIGIAHVAGPAETHFTDGWPP
jgi:hypothetical protein